MLFLVSFGVQGDITKAGKTAIKKKKGQNKFWRIIAPGGLRALLLSLPITSIPKMQIFC